MSEYPEVAAEVAARLEQLEGALQRLVRKKADNAKDGAGDADGADDDSQGESQLDEVERAARGLQVKKGGARRGGECAVAKFYIICNLSLLLRLIRDASVY